MTDEARNQYFAYLVLLAVARGKQLQHKRETLHRREIDRETRAAWKARQR